VFERLQLKESLKYVMDNFYPNTPTKFGKPLCFACWSTVEVTLRALKTPKARPGTWIEFQIIDKDLEPLKNSHWREDSCRPDNVDESNNELTWSDKEFESQSFQPGSKNPPSNKIKWEDISAPFSEASLRLRLYEDNGGSENLMAEMWTPLSRLSSDNDIPYEPIQSPDQDLRPGEIEGWFTLRDLDDNNRRAYYQSSSRQSGAFKQNKRDKTPTSRESCLSKKNSKFRVHLRLFVQEPETDRRLRMLSVIPKFIEKVPSSSRSPLSLRSQQSIKNAQVMPLEFEGSPGAKL
jgi:hypothetical protein